MKFEKLSLRGWRQFSEVVIDIHPRMTIITGANGAGKTTILRLLSQHFGWHHVLLATPTGSPEQSGAFKYITGLFRRFVNQPSSVPDNRIGSIQYSNGDSAQIVVPENAGVAYSAEIQGQQQVTGLHINSHRSVQSYQQITSIPAQAIGAEQAYQTYWNEIIQRYNGAYTQFSPMYRMKESLISMATFGAGNQYVQKNVVLEKLFLDFKQVLTKVLPPTIGFIDISVRMPDVVVVTKTGEFVIDAASGGLMSLIELAWQIFLFSHDKDDFTVTIDEPENHLHPSMQRTLLRRFVDAFPKAQFIVVTHSPFIVSSVKESFVYALTYDDHDDGTVENWSKRKISSIRLDLDNKAATASEILRDVLGVPVTLPEWAEDALVAIAREFSGNVLTEDALNALRMRLREAGLGEYYPDALKIVVGRPND